MIWGIETHVRPKFDMRNKKYFLIVVGTAIVIKISLFLFASIHTPQSKFLPDSFEYLKTSEMLTSKGAFAVPDVSGSLRYELNRAPGYPFFLAILHGFMGISLNGIILIQILLTILAAFVTYKTAIRIDPKLGFLSAGIVLCSIVVSVFSLMILTETLFLFLMTLFMFEFVQYLKSGDVKALVMSSLMLVMATYVRPGSYFLGFVMVCFIVYANVSNNIKKTILHALVFLVVVYGLLGIWQVRNYMIFGNAAFSSIFQEDPLRIGLYKSYLRNTDPSTQKMGPISYYINVTWRCFLSIMTRPGSFKYLHWHALTIFGKVVGYPLVVFWMTGLVYGIAKAGRNVCYRFLSVVIIYFICGSIISEMWFVGERFRMPVVPFIAIISAYGWAEIIALVKRNKGPSRLTWENVKGVLIGGDQMKKIVKRLALTVFFISAVMAVGFVIWIQDQYVVPIMMYHSVSLADDNSSNVVDPGSFAKQMNYLKNNGYHVIPLDDYVEGNKARKKFPHKTVVITFDDGYSDNYKNAFPVLKGRHFPATIFLISDMVGVSENLLTWDQVKEMGQYGITFGSHTRHHVYLPEASEEEMKDEIVGSKRVIEEHLGKPVDYFAYPSGGFSERIKTITALAGYKAALTTNRGYDRYDIDLYELNRVHINNGDNRYTFWFKLSGYYNLFRKLRSSH